MPAKPDSLALSSTLVQEAQASVHNGEQSQPGISMVRFPPLFLPEAVAGLHAAQMSGILVSFGNLVSVR